MMQLLLALLRKAAWAPVLVFTLHVVASQVFDAYKFFPWIDIPMHLAGGLAISYFFLVALTSTASDKVFGSLSTLVVGIMVLSLTTSATVIWEFAEWTSDRFFRTHAQGGIDDTMGDMFIGMLGGVLVACYYCLISSK